MQGSSFDSNLGETEAALASFRKAIANWQAVAKANPDNTIDQLHVAYGHRIFAVMYSTTGQPGSREELDQAMAISARMLVARGNVPQVPNERSLEYEVLAGLQNDAGDFAGALQSLREDLALKEQVQTLKPDYPNLKPSMAVIQVELGDVMARLGSRAEALRLNQAGLDLYRSLDNNGTDARVRRELAITLYKRGDILLMDATPAGALENYRQALAILEPMANADPHNALLRQDMAEAWSNIGRALVIESRYTEASAMLDRAVSEQELSVQQDRSLKETQFALGVSLIWRGEAQFKEGQAKAALESFRNAVLRFEDAGNGSNAARIGLAVGHTKMASALAALGETQEASAEYRKALAILEPQSTNLSARYAYADVYFEAGEVSRKLAERPEATSIERRQLWSDASDWYQKSADASGKIQNPGLVSPQGFTYHGPAQATRAILSCKRAIRQLAQSTP